MKTVLFLLGLFFSLGDACYRTPTLQYGEVIVIKKSNITYHTYTSLISTGIEVDTHIIEFPTKLVIFDAQMHIPTAKEVLTYAQSLNKPIDGVYISHYHIDHWGGLQVFKEVAKTYALQETIDEIKADGQAAIDRVKPTAGDKVPNAPVVPDNVVQNGELKSIDGIEMKFERIQKGETANSMVLKMPAQKTALVGDFIFNKVHLFLGSKYFNEWTSNLRDWQTSMSSYDLFLLGHNKPASFATIHENIAYLTAANATYATSASFSIFKAEMIKLFPYFANSFILDIAQNALYPSAGKK